MDRFICKDITNINFDIKDVDGKKGIVVGYFSEFNSIDSDGDIIRTGAFAKSISENGPKSNKPRIKHLLNHDTYKPLGVITDLTEDAKGLRYESKLGTHSLGVDFIKMVESGLITEHSIGFQTIKYNQLMSWSDWKQGDAARELTEIKLYEGSSLTAWGANQNTPLVSLKSEDKTNTLIKKIDVLAKAIRNGKFTDETFEMLEIELRQMQQAIIDISAMPEPKSTSPDAIQTISNFINSLKN